MAIQGVPHGLCRPTLTPYREWGNANSRPSTWMEDVTHLSDKLEKFRPRSSAAARSPESPGIPAPAPGIPLRSMTHDFFCQVSDSCRIVSCQSESAKTCDVGAGPDLMHLGTAVALFRPFWIYRPPLPIRRVGVSDANAVIRGLRSFAAIPPDVELPENQSPPESAREVEGPDRLRPAAPHLLPLLTAHPHRCRPPPPFDPLPQPPIRDPGYIPVPPGIRAVYTTLPCFPGANQK